MAISSISSTTQSSPATQTQDTQRLAEERKNQAAQQAEEERRRLQAERPVPNSEGQTTGTRINTTA